MPTIMGTDAAETLSGGVDDDYISGLGGSDSLSGLDGADSLSGGAGNDTLDGGAGSDTLSDTDGSDRLLGGPGFDIITVNRSQGGGQTIYVDGGGDTDLVSLRISNVNATATVLGGDGDDEIRVYGSIGGLVDGGAGNDLVVVGDTLTNPGPQTRQVTLGSGSDRLRYDFNYTTVITVTDFQTGDAGDRLEMRPGLDILGWDGATNPFSTGHFRLEQRGADVVLQRDQDGPGTAQTLADIVVFQNTTLANFTSANLFGYAANGAGPTPAPNGGTPAKDFLFGSAGNDSLAGLGDRDELLGRAGNDTLDGGDDDDYLAGESGADSLVGGADNDYLLGDGDAADSAGNDTLSGGDGRDVLDGGRGDDQVFGGAGNDSITERSGTNYLRGDEGDDWINGGVGFDDINGNMGNDTCISGGGDDWVVGGKDNDSLMGGAGANLVYGNLGADTCDGGDGDDIVRGGQGDDVISGGAGNDFLAGDRDNDTISGGSGADIFSTHGAAGIDRVTDFSLVQGDRVQLDAGTQYTLAQVGADTVINMTGGGQMILVGVQMSSLTPGWIFGN